MKLKRVCAPRSSVTAAAGLGPLAGSVGAESNLKKSLLLANFVLRVLDLNYRRAFLMNTCISKTKWEYSLEGSLSLQDTRNHGNS